MDFYDDRMDYEYEREEAYKREFCSRCFHYVDGCLVLDAHKPWAYESPGEWTTSEYVDSQVGPIYECRMLVPLELIERGDC